MVKKNVRVEKMEKMSTDDIKKFLSDSIRNLHAGIMTPKEAHGMATLVGKYVQVINAELRFFEKSGRKPPENFLITEK